MLRFPRRDGFIREAFTAGVTFRVFGENSFLANKKQITEFLVDEGMFNQPKEFQSASLCFRPCGFPARWKILGVFKIARKLASYVEVGSLTKETDKSNDSSFELDGLGRKYDKTELGKFRGGRFSSNH